jgi:hypothetical protein
MLHGGVVVSLCLGKELYTIEQLRVPFEEY